ncbi:hypothetical protein A6V39_00245 [Candidatus Mycoplasma haematobovis]|uniref:Uncharacterized protein n=1 Tax=Candidatus Mycoplasma haematobovis TaxID=432608 RepID=A0A1A9QFI8_9MOLU|nr:hypothetical protein [Candidatus Mycoplasma haematobovis]OAL10479.1 hypothetical protein A6V39_00245 [Candidatus Mycoplasma haematobovis]
MSTKVIVSSIAGVGVLGGSVAGTYHFLSQKSEEKSLEQVLTAENKIPLKTSSNTDDGDWGKLVTKFLATDNSVTVTKINVTGIVNASLGTGNNNTENIRKLKKACQALLKKTKDYANDKVIAENWCTKASPLLK